MTRAQRETLAALMIRGAASIVENLETLQCDGELIEEFPNLIDITQEDARRVLAGWMAKLPGRYWDERLGDT